MPTFFYLHYIRLCGSHFSSLRIAKMSVLNQCGDDAAECPLCMEHLEVDDINFFPCTCGYQVQNWFKTIQH
jgi:RING/Ubox like zinc-binding domain